MAESGVVVCSGSLGNNVSTGKGNANENCIHCLNLGREVVRLHQELGSANDIIKILKKVQKLGQQHYTYMKWMINSDTIANFQIQLSYELWESVFDEKDVNMSFNTFLNTFLSTYYSSFHLV
jgi:hypothetical protein